jgi:coproporphyrinogen III oxidase
MINRTPPDFLTPDMADFSVRVADWFEKLRDNICGQFETIESDAEDSPLSDQPSGHFERKNWTRDGGGGGQISVMHGRVFEKVGVNISVVHGQFAEDFRAQIPGATDDGQFWAGGISLVAHPQNPFVPAAHMNTRFVITSKAWFGGGGDLTPLKPAPKQANTFHADLKACCERHDPDYYPKYKQWCDDYFYLKHRDEPRGAGGIFYDYLDSGDREADFSFTRDVGSSFAGSYVNIVRETMNKHFTAEDRHFQLVRRGRYVEFNLLYDRGTSFGLKTGGNIEAILMSLPPEVRWP